jgi:DNA-binding beta-propeller fold protein YncE
MKFSVVALLLAALAAAAQYPDFFLGSVSVGQNPTDVCLSPDGSRAYVAVGFGFATVIDINDYSDFSLAGLAYIDGEPVTLQCDVSGNYLFVADTENSLVHVVDTSDLSIVKDFSIQPDPSDMVLSPQENRIYLSHESGMITVIDTQSQEVTDVFWAGSEINSMAITPSADLIFAADDQSPEEAVINTSTGAVTHFSSGMDSYGCTVSGDGARLFLSCLSWELIEVVDAESFTIETTVACPGNTPGKMVTLPDLPYLYGVCPDQNSITVIGTDDLAVKGDIAVTGGPSNIAVHPDGERLFVVCTGDNKLKIFGFDPSGIAPRNSELTLRVLNSPSSSPSLMVSSTGPGYADLKIFDVAGRTVQEEYFSVAPGTANRIMVDNLPRGVFTATVSMEGGSCQARLVVLPR